MRKFFPVNKKDIKSEGWDSVDFAVVTGDAYIDHPSFGAAIIARVLESDGFKVGIISQPDWTDPESIKILGRPVLGFLITSGNIDSMVNHFTAAKKRRRSDVYTPGGKTGKRPDRAVTVYSNMAKGAYKGVPVIIGGIEASLRRMAHYDYWKDSLRRSVLLDSKADLLVYGMAENTVRRIAARLAEGKNIKEITDINGTVFAVREEGIPQDALMLPDYEDIKKNKKLFAESFRMQYLNSDPYSGKILAEPYGGKRFVVQNPPAVPLSRKEMDFVYSLPYARAPHPSYKEEIPAFKEIKFSLISNRGCYGDCSFCALAFHQGRIVSSRSPQSLIREAEILIKDKDFKGYIHDVGGPTTNFNAPACVKQEKAGSCPAKRCLTPKPCPSLKADHGEYIDVLRKLRNLEGVKKVFIRSGIRFDYALLDKEHDFITELCKYHVSGQLKVAPEHVSPEVLKIMGKPPRHIYDKFVKQFYKTNKKLGKKQYLIPYFISGHPGSSIKDAVMLAEYLRDTHFIPEQVQDFYPTPGTLATAMWYSGTDPMSGKKVHIPRSGREKAMQRALLQYNRPENYVLVREALEKAGRRDLIGNGPEALIGLKPPAVSTAGKEHGKPSARTGKVRKHRRKP